MAREATHLCCASVSISVVLSPTSKDTNSMNQQVAGDEIRDEEVVCSTMDAGMSISGQAESTGVTTFANEACEGVEIFSSYKPSTLVMAQPDLQDLKAYFSRPRLINRAAFNLGVRGWEASSIMDATSFVTNFPQWYQRLSGVFAIRFKLHFRVQVACTAFHQGVYVLNWQYEDTGVSTTQFSRGSRAETCTNLPHTRLDLTESTMAELSIPFLWHAEYYPVKATNLSATQTYGTFYLTSVLPTIAVASLNAPTYEVYTYLTEVELFGADNNTTTTINLQSGGTASLIHKEVKDNHLLSRGFSAVGKIGSFVVNKVPSLASVAGPVAWAADIAAGVARYFGYSRPMIQDPPMRVNRSLYASESNVDVPMAGYVCGTMQSNTLAVTPEFGGTDVDEMAFSYIKSQYSQICYGLVTTSDTHNKVIYATPISPVCFWFRAPATAPYCNLLVPASSANLISQSGNGFMPSSLMHLASFFRLWRGSIKFRFTFAKTKFHGGRYMISYNPDSVLKTIPTNYSTVDGPEVVSTLVQPYGYSKIVDLKDGNIFEFDVPYLSEAPYLSYESSSGGLSVVCIDPLQASASVTSSVPFIVEVCGGSDFDVADYGGPYYVPSPSATIYTQSGGSATVKTAVTEPSSITIGERLMSVKQIIQIPWWGKYTQGSGTTVDTSIAPWFTNLCYSNIAAGLALPMSSTISVAGGGNAAGHWARCFVFAKGSTDVHIYGLGGTVCYLEQRPQTYRSASTRTKAYVGRPFTGSTPKIITNGEHPIHARLPAFSTYVRTPVNAYDTVGFLPYNSPADANTAWRAHHDMVRAYAGGSALSVYIARAAGDDAALAHYIGPVPQYIPNAANTNFLDTDWT